ncbi:coniferyl aldehyde dehydrogenase [Paraburkholderia saeva]|uniref:coniferyl aldehyde dehydrogenase n=1 Tax=Paraburkholderia saeva TaxID=2777537 RepID=UPI001DB1844D|nr:coniferyl aldehyde dehydrogenase [Paraburkholderia saeva]CAG4923845.1 Coniferyl aldehyde dehydrogenase [Paraburkholderia saeva]
MNLIDMERHAQTGATDFVAERFATLRSAFAAAPYPGYIERRDKLRRLREALRRHAPDCASAASVDFGVRAADETMLVDLLPSLLHIDHLLRHLQRWMRPSRRSPELLFSTNRAAVQYQPKGVVGIVVPWNFPFYLALGPLATALAAGNRCLIKTSEYAPHASRSLRALLADAFDEDEVCVVEGDAECAKRFCALPFDHLVFTGSPAVGREVMRAAADNLTPVTLELGGKSPALVSRSANLARAARRIVHGKTVNAGQVCVASDYALVPREQVDAFTAAAAHAFEQLVGAGERYTSMINARAHRRMLDLVDDARALGAKVTVCGPVDNEGRQIPLHIITGVKPQMRIAREEIFGPLLPVIGYATFDEALAHVRSGERPLALYWFGTDSSERTRVLRETHAGGVTFNDWGWHAMNHSLPFGGIGMSGMGNYHGEEGFRELSHAKAVFAEHRWFPVELFHPPYGRAVQRAVLRWYFGSRA